MYAVYHGPEGLKKIAERVRKFTRILDLALKDFGFNQINKHYFDTLQIESDYQTCVKIKSLAERKMINFRYIDDEHIGISLNEATEERDVVQLVELFAEISNRKTDNSFLSRLSKEADKNFEDFISRKSNFLTYEVFNTYHSETELLRYMKMLENRDLSLVHSMTPLGSCTMKLNATTEMLPITWDEFANIHPFATG